MSRSYAWAFATLGFALAIIAILLIIFGLKVIDLRNQLRIRDQNDKIQKVANCNGEILGTKVAGIVIDGLRDDYRSRAKTWRQIARVDSTEAQRRVHLAAAKSADRKAAALASLPDLFPHRTAKQCKALARSLGVSLPAGSRR